MTSIQLYKSLKYEENKEHQPKKDNYALELIH